MKPLILLDFDGVLFNSAYEAYEVCQRVSEQGVGYRRGVSFDEFMVFRAYLTDAWQFNRLYGKDRVLRDVTRLHEIEPDEADWSFSKEFFAARAEMMRDPDWAKLMSPYPFFYQLRPLLLKHTETFKILSTRNRASLERTLEFFEIDGLELYGQEDIRDHGSKLAVATAKQWLDSGRYVVYVDDMNAHLEPFEADVDLCIHAGWGYDVAHVDSYTQSQAFQIVTGFLRLAYD